MYMETNEKKWCVYMHRNKENDKTYIGITSRDVIRRWGRNGNGYRQDDNPVFYNAIQKYGWDNFEHIIWAENLLEKEAKEWEIRLIALFKTNCRKYKSPELGYNLNDGGDGNPGHILSEESRKKISQNHADVSGKNNPMYGKSAMKGRKHSEESKQKMRESQKGKIFSDEHKKNLSVSKIGKFKGGNSPNARKVVQLSLKMKFISYFDSIIDAANFTKTNRSSIRECCIGNRKTAGGFKWMYIEDYERMLSENAETCNLQ